MAVKTVMQLSSAGTPYPQDKRKVFPLTSEQPVAVTGQLELQSQERCDRVQHRRTSSEAAPATFSRCCLSRAVPISTMRRWAAK